MEGEKWKLKRRAQDFIQDFEMEGGEHGGSMVIVARESMLTHA